MDWLKIGSYLVLLLVPVVASVLTTFYITGKRVLPVIDEAKQAMANMGKLAGIKSGEVRGDKAMEKAFAEDILDANLPELKLLLEMASPDLLEMIKENPEGALRIAQKWGLLELDRAENVEYTL